MLTASKSLEQLKVKEKASQMESLMKNQEQLNRSSIINVNTNDSLLNQDNLAIKFQLLGITDRQNTSGLRTKKYVITDTPRFNDLNARCVIKISNNQYKAKYARILIRERKNYDKENHNENKTTNSNN